MNPNCSLGDYMPGDPALVNTIVAQLKSQGTFDQFRKECIADVDTKPAYQNLRSRVDAYLGTYLARLEWTPNLSKNQFREFIRKYLTDSSFFDQGVERVVEQVVLPKVRPMLIPKVEDAVYKIARSNDENNEIDSSSFGYEQLPFDDDVAYSANGIQSDEKTACFGGISEDGPMSKFPLADVSNNTGAEDVDDEISPPFEPHIPSDNRNFSDSDFSYDDDSNWKHKTASQQKEQEVLPVVNELEKPESKMRDDIIEESESYKLIRKDKHHKEGNVKTKSDSHRSSKHRDKHKHSSKNKDKYDKVFNDKSKEKKCDEQGNNCDGNKEKIEESKVKEVNEQKSGHSNYSETKRRHRHKSDREKRNKSNDRSNKRKSSDNNNESIDDNESTEKCFETKPSSLYEDQFKASAQE